MVQYPNTHLLLKVATFLALSFAAPIENDMSGRHEDTEADPRYGVDTFYSFKVKKKITLITGSQP